MICKETIKELVSVADLMAVYGFDLHREGGSQRGPCPFCGGSDSANKFVVLGQLWHCKACDRGGDVISLHSAYRDLHFSHAISDIARIFEIPDEGISLTKLVTTKDARDKEREDYLTEQEKNVETAQKLWSRLYEDSDAGVKYLISRRVLPARQFVRFGEHSACLALHDITGRIINVVARDFTESASSRMASLPKCSTLGTFGTHIGARRQVVIVEGVFDFLSAVTMQVGGADTNILGVHGVTNMPKIVAGIVSSSAPGRRYIFVPQNDQPAKDALARSITVLTNWGVPPKDIVIKAIPDTFCDLNDLLTEGGTLC